MKLNDFITNFNFENGVTKLHPYARYDFKPVENPRLFTIGFNASFNRRIERTEFIHDVEQNYINAAIDAIYIKLESRLAELKAAQAEDNKYFIDCKLSLSIKQQEVLRAQF